MKDHTNNFNVLIDSGAFIAQLLPDDLFHQDAVSAFQRLKSENRLAVTTSAVIGETLTVLSHRGGQQLANQFYDQIDRSGLPVIHIDEDFHEEATTLFLTQAKKGTSYVDCANAAVAKRLGIAQIFTYDGFYKQVGFQTFK